jgi:hypothetical protein
MAATNELINSLLADYKNPENLNGTNGLLSVLVLTLLGIY